LEGDSTTTISVNQAFQSWAGWARHPVTGQGFNLACKFKFQEYRRDGGAGQLAVPGQFVNHYRVGANQRWYSFSPPRDFRFIGVAVNFRRLFGETAAGVEK
jgi:hypothetical protein